MRVNTKVVSDILSGEVLERRSFDYVGTIARAMGVRLASVFSTTFIGPLPASAVETVCLTTGPIIEAIDNAAIILLWMASITPGTSTTSLVYRIRRGTTAAGAQVGAGAWSFTTVAANLTTVSGFYVDSPGIVANQQYSLTCVQTADTVAGSWVDGALLAMVL